MNHAVEKIVMYLGSFRRPAQGVLGDPKERKKLKQYRYPAKG